MAKLTYEEALGLIQASGLKVTETVRTRRQIRFQVVDRRGRPKTLAVKGVNNGSRT